MSFVDIFTAKSQQLYWAPLPESNVVDGAKPSPIEKNQAYFVLRMKEMYVAYSRKLWRKLYPMLHSFVEHGKTQENAIAGPGQLRELGDSNLERIVNLNYPEQARRLHIYGKLQLSVSINKDGSVESIEVSRSSGQPILDAAAMRIVKLAAPYSPLPPSITRDTDILTITRTWSFTASDRMESE